MSIERRKMKEVENRCARHSSDWSEKMGSEDINGDMQAACDLVIRICMEKKK